MLQVSIDSNIDEIEKKLSEITDRSRLVMMRAMNRNIIYLNQIGKMKQSLKSLL